MKKQVQNLLLKNISDHVFPGAAAAWIRGGEEQSTAAGHYTYEPSSPLVTPHTQYDVASITKAIPTTSLALYLAEREKLNLDVPVINYLPEYRGDHREELLVRHLVEFRAPFAVTLSEYKNQSPAALLETILHAPMTEAPGGEAAYINTTSILLTLILQKVTNQSLEKIAQEIFFSPLGMKNTTFSPRAENTPPTEIDPWRNKTLQGEVHDESAWKLQSIMTPGSAGLFSTALDLLKFAAMILKNGRYQQHQFFSPPTIASMTTRLGWETQTGWLQTCPPGTFGKTGFTGCCIVINPEKNIAGVLLSNATWPHRSDQRGEQLLTLRQAFCQSLFANL